MPEAMVRRGVEKRSTSDARPKVLIVGAFPAGSGPKIYGGQVSVCTRLLDSSFVETHHVRTLDTTQISNPPPSLAARALLAVRRLVVFALEMLFHRPDALILFLARGASVYEKGLMARLAGLLGVAVLVFPRAGRLMDDFTHSPAHARFVRGTLGRADIFLCQGRTFQDFAVAQLGFDVAHAPVVPNWTALDEHLTLAATRERWVAGAVPRLLFLGWLEDFKGVFELLEVARQLSQAGVPYHLTLAGNGSAMNQARLFVDTHDLADEVDFAGWVGETAKTALLEQSDILVLPSWSEGLPNAMIEAMSAGLACVVTEVGMIPDYVVNGRDALTVPSRDIPALYSAIRRLIEEEELRQTIAANGHNLARQQFSLEQGATRLAAAVVSAMAR